jgi:hypothetical protein
MENKSVPNIQSKNDNQFLRFSRKIESGKHSYWFECLNENRKKILYKEYLNKKKVLEESNKSFSLNKFLFNMRESKYFFIPKIKIREAAIEKLLTDKK